MAMSMQGVVAVDYGILGFSNPWLARQTRTMQFDRSSAQARSKQAALAALYDEYFDRIASYIFVRMGDRSEAEDLAGEVFLKALQSLGSYKERGVPMQAWLFKIAHNLVVDHLRKTKKRKNVPIEYVEVVSESDPQEIAEANIEFARVSRALDRLTLAQRQVIELRFFGELSAEETAKVMNKGAGAVRELQCAAIKALRKMLYEETGTGNGGI
jgi:RNA polymerase sigma-70 factor (ECF subfamily)